MRDESFTASSGWGGIDARKVRAKHTDTQRIYVEVVMLFTETVEHLKVKFQRRPSVSDSEACTFWILQYVLSAKWYFPNRLCASPNSVR